MSILALLSTIITITINALANILPINGYSTGELSDKYPNLFVPAGITFSIWALIFFMLLTFSITYIYLEFRLKKKHTKVLSLFILSNILNISWIFSWHYEYILISLIIMLMLLITLIVLYLSLRRFKYNIGYNIFVKGTISLYLGWISIATIANIVAFLISINWNTWGLGEVFWTIAIILFALFLTLVFTYYQRDLTYNSVIIWALIGIIIKRVNTDFSSTYPIVITCIISILIIIVFTIKRFSRKIKI